MQKCTKPYSIVWYMNFLESNWLIQMLDRNGKSPSDRILALFTCVEDWISAPGVWEQFQREFQLNQPIIYDCPNLTKYLVKQSNEARVPQPNDFVNQLMFLLQGAITEEIRNPGSSAFHAAKSAAAALLKAASMSDSRNFKINWIGKGLVASLAVTIGLSLFLNMRATSQPVSMASSSVEVMHRVDQLSPDLVEKILSLQTQIELGNCPSPQLFSMPQDQMAIYMDVIHFRESIHPASDAKKIRDFLTWYSSARAWECYYPPANGHTSVKWGKT